LLLPLLVLSLLLTPGACFWVPTKLIAAITIVTSTTPTACCFKHNLKGW
jgi:hypothetical protein